MKIRLNYEIKKGYKIVKDFQIFKDFHILLFTRFFKNKLANFVLMFIQREYVIIDTIFVLKKSTVSREHSRTTMYEKLRTKANVGKCTKAHFDRIIQSLSFSSIHIFF